MALENLTPLRDPRPLYLQIEDALIQLLADSEDITLSDEHWKVLSCLRKQYRYDGLPRHARYLAKSLIREFATQGGNKYLRKLFPGGPITQGSRFANVSVPPDAADASHGCCY